MESTISLKALEPYPYGTHVWGNTKIMKTKFPKAKAEEFIKSLKPYGVEIRYYVAKTGNVLVLVIATTYHVVWDKIKKGK